MEFKMENASSNATPDDFMPVNGPRSSAKFISIIKFLISAGLALFTFHCAFFNLTCVDTGFHIQTGALVLSGGHIPSVNTFSFSMPDNPWLLHQWLPGVLYYALFHFAGFAGLITFNALTAAAIFYVVFISARIESRDIVWAALAVTAGVLLARVRFFVRPYMFSALFLAILFLTLRSRLPRKWRCITISSLFALWANTHAGVVYGFMLITAFAGGQFLEAIVYRHQSKISESATAFRETLFLIILAALSVVVSFLAVEIINPSGVKVLLLPFIYAMDPFWSDLIAEFHPPAGADRFWLIIFSGTIITLIPANWKQIDFRLLSSTLCFAVLAFMSQRSILDYTIVAVPHLALLLSRIMPQLVLKWTGIRAIFLALIWCGASCFVILPDQVFRFGIGVFEPYYPMGVYNFIKTRVPPQRMYNDMRYGGGILWFLYPGFRPFIDGRCEAYSREFWQNEYVPTSMGINWTNTFAKYQIEAALLPAPASGASADLSAELKHNPEWALVAFDDNTLLFLKRTPGNSNLIHECEYRVISPADRTLSTITPGNANKVISEAARALALPGPGTFARTALARGLKEKHLYSDAASIFAQFVSTPYASDQYWRDYSYCVFMSGDRQNLPSILASMKRSNHDPAYAYYLEHFLALERGDSSNAVKLLDVAIHISPAPYLSTARDTIQKEAIH